MINTTSPHRHIAAVLLAALLTSAGCFGASSRPSRPSPTSVNDVVVTCAGQPVAGVIAKMNGITATTDQDGRARIRGLWRVMPDAVLLAVDVPDGGPCLSKGYDRIDYTGTDRTIESGAGPWRVELALAPIVVPPTPVKVERRTGAAVLDVRACFINGRDAQGRVMFDPFILSLAAEERQDWYARKRQCGATHLVLAANYGYPGSPIPGRDFRRDVPAFRALLEEILDTPAADGIGFAVIVMWSDTPDEIDTYWPDLIPPVADLMTAHGISVPAWEPEWRSADVGRSITRLRQLVGPAAPIFFHGKPGRAVGSSFLYVSEEKPAARGEKCHAFTEGDRRMCYWVEDDDPWDGSEPGFWTDQRLPGRELSGFLYQTPHGREIVDRCGRRDDGTFAESCWLNRWQDIVARLGAGRLSNDRGEDRGPGWRKVVLVLFETVGYDLYRGSTDDARAREVADEGDALCRAWNVVCGFGNGLPNRLTPAGGGIQ